MRARIEKADHALMLAITRLRHPALTLFFRILTVSGQGWFWAVVVISLWLGIHFDLIHYPHRELLLQAAITPGIAWVLVQTLKLIFKRRRPSQILPEYTALSKAPSNDSFPSGHTASVFAFFIATLSLGNPISATIGGWATLVAYSRYYLGVHFPSDIIVGAIIGSFAGLSLGGITEAFSLDHYPSYTALVASEKEGRDFSVEVNDRGSEFLVMAIHGGTLENGTDDLGVLVADGKQSSYFFRVKAKDARRLHVTATHFNDPRLIALAEKSRVCVSLHGYQDEK
jgi:undecaprenyl-diphosphatase